MSTQENTEEIEEEIDYSGCPAVGGYHSKHYHPEEGGMCQWCGETPPLSRS